MSSRVKPPSIEISARFTSLSGINMFHVSNVKYKLKSEAKIFYLNGIEIASEALRIDPFSEKK